MFNELLRVHGANRNSTRATAGSSVGAAIDVVNSSCKCRRDASRNTSSLCREKRKRNFPRNRHRVCPKTLVRMQMTGSHQVSGTSAPCSYRRRNTSCDESRESYSAEQSSPLWTGPRFDLHPARRTLPVVQPQSTRWLRPAWMMRPDLSGRSFRVAARFGNWGASGATEQALLSYRMTMLEHILGTPATRSYRRRSTSCDESRESYSAEQSSPVWTGHTFDPHPLQRPQLVAAQPQLAAQPQPPRWPRRYRWLNRAAVVWCGCRGVVRSTWYRTASSDAADGALFDQHSRSAAS